MRLIAIALLALCTAVPAAAQTAAARLTCTPPTKRTNGTPLTNLAGFRFYRATSPAGPYEQIADVSDCSYVDSELEPGTSYYWVATAYDASGVESEFSNVASKTTPDPEPPALRVPASEPWAYELILSRDRVATNIIGRVPAGTQCDETQPVLGFHVVPRGAVQWLGDARAEVVLARCSIF